MKFLKKIFFIALIGVSIGCEAIDADEAARKLTELRDTSCLGTKCRNKITKGTITELHSSIAAKGHLISEIEQPKKRDKMTTYIRLGQGGIAELCDIIGNLNATTSSINTTFNTMDVVCQVKRGTTYSGGVTWKGGDHAEWDKITKIVVRYSTRNGMPISLFPEA